MDEIQIPLFAPGTEPFETERKEPRESLVRNVEFCRFPRICADQRLRLGFTRDVSESGLCLRAESAEPRGALLRVMLRNIDGEPLREAIARVVWTAPAGSGGHWMGLALEAGRRQPIRIRYLRGPNRLARSA